MPYIQSIGIAEAPFKHAQKDILSFMLDMYPEHFDQQDKVARLYDRSEIETRYSAIEDFSLQKWCDGIIRLLYMNLIFGYHSTYHINIFF